jgi:integrase
VLLRITATGNRGEYEMIRWPMVHQRGEVFYVRLTVPLRVQAAYGRKDVWVSLRTRDPEIAKVKALTVTAKLKETFRRLDQTKAVAMEPAELAALYQRQALAEDVEHRLVASLRAEDQTDEPESLALTTRLEALDDDPASIYRLLDRVLLTYGVRVEPEDRPRFAQALLTSERELLKSALARAGDPAGPTSEPPGVTVAELVEAYLADRKLPVKMQQEVRTIASRFGQTIGHGMTRAARLVTRADVRRYRATVLASDRSVSTMKKQLGSLATIWKWGVTAGHVEENPWAGMTGVPSRGAQPPGRLPYSPAQVRVLLTESEKLEGVKRWMVPLLAYGGMRVEEAGGARVCDVQQERGVWFLDLAPTKDRTLKTRGSARRVPLHPEMIRAGFLLYVQGLPADSMLFPDLTRQPAKGKYTVGFGRWFARWSGGLGHGLDDPRVSLHSLRHSAKRAMRDAGVSEELSDLITGHSTSLVSRRYGQGASLKVLAEAVSKISFEEE